MAPRRSEKAREYRAKWDKETTVGGDTPRKGSVYWRPLGPLVEITLYPLLFGVYLLTVGRRDKDSWAIGYHYPDYQSGFRAAEEWDGKGDPGHGWIKKLDGEFEDI